MGVIDTSQWKAFHLYDIFQIDMGNKFDRGKMPVGDEVNFVGRTGVNNGINAVCGFVENVEPYPPGLITLALGGTIGACFVQPRKFYTSQNVIVLKPKQKLSFAMKEFVSTIIWRVSNIYYSAFSNELNRHIKTDFMFWLPVTPSGEPDWSYMDSFMGKILKEEEVAAEQLAALAPESEADGHFLDVSGWKAFRIGDLFEKLSLGFKANRKFDKALDVDTKPSNEFDLPLVNAKDGNNGIMYWGRSADWDSAEMTLDIVMDGAVSAGNVYAQPQHTGVLYNAYLIKPFCSMSANCLQFVATVMQSAIKEQFGYMNKCTWDRVSALPIYLPVTSDGQPDWAWMEQYMKQQLDKVASLSEHLNEVMK